MEIDMEIYAELAALQYNTYRTERMKFGYHILPWEVLTLVEKQVWYKIASLTLIRVAGATQQSEDDAPPYDSMR